MGAKQILQRYMERNSSALPEDREELRRHIAAVATGSARLRVTGAELDELAGIEPKPAKPKKRRNKAGTRKMALDIDRENLKAFEKS
jgi:hypothetical protein